MKEKALLIIDCGTSNVRAVLMLVDSGETAAMASLKNEWKQAAKGRSQMDAMSLWDHAQTVVEMIIKEAGADYTILGIGFSYFGDSLIVVDENLNPLYDMIMAFDTRAQKEAADLADQTGPDRFRRIVGGPCLSMLVCSKIMWLRQHEPAVFQKARYFLNIQEFILAKLNLGIHTDYTLANRKAMLDIEQKEWSAQLASAVGVSRKQLGETIGDSTQVVGRLRKFGRVTLPNEVPVVLGAHDSECGFLGLGVSPYGGRSVGNVSGTYEMLGCFSQSFGQNLEPTLAEWGCGLRRDSMVLNGSSIAGSYVKWFQQELCKKPDTMFADMEKVLQYDARNQVLFLADNDRQNYTLEGLDTSTGTPQIYQAVIEGITYKLKEILTQMEQVNEGPFQFILSGGGGASSDKWLQFKADLFQKEIRRVRNQEVSALGAGIIAAVGIGYYDNFEDAIANMIHAEKVFLPNQPVSELYQEQYQKYVQRKTAH